MEGAAAMTISLPTWLWIALAVGVGVVIVWPDVRKVDDADDEQAHGRWK